VKQISAASNAAAKFDLAPTIVVGQFCFFYPKWKSSSASQSDIFSAKKESSSTTVGLFYSQRSSAYFERSEKQAFLFFELVERNKLSYWKARSIFTFL